MSEEAKASEPPPPAAAAAAEAGGEEVEDDAEVVAAAEQRWSAPEVVSEAGESEELKAQQKERLESVRKTFDAAEGTDAADEEAKRSKRLEYLMAQSEVFAHFLVGRDDLASSKRKGKKKGAGGGRTRMTEAAEDAALMTNALSKQRVTRLDRQPSNIKNGTLRPYQLEGLNWMIRLNDNGVNGILADEMGLGKTLQCISLIAYLREARSISGPHIVIVPKSVCGNWMREFAKWCPEVRTLKLLGSKEERKRILKDEMVPGGFDVLVTSYECVLREKGALCKVPWRYLMIDEAHRIKNENSSLSKTVRLFKTQSRLLVTGTPLQNNLHELWALLNFLLPDVFSDSDTFDEWFNLDDEGGKDNVIRKLHTVLKPFMLRRVKRDVEKSLPPKTETKLFIGMSNLQREMYRNILSKEAMYLNSLGGPSRVQMLNILMQLRKVCNHPYLFEGAEEGPPFTNGPHLWSNCGKMTLLCKLLPKLQAQGSRVLIFSQMTRMLDVLEDVLQTLDQGSGNFRYLRLDGQTSAEDRDQQMEDFNAKDSPYFTFLLSTRAGGLGINLNTADVVVLYDSDWNPQMDLQAMDRAHRIGQTKPVRVFRFVTEGTVEEKIVERAERKLFLDAAVIQQGRLADKNTQLAKDELMTMVRFGAEQIMQNQGGTITDEDIDVLLKRGEERTQEEQSRIKQDMQHSLANFSLVTEEPEQSIFGADAQGQARKKKGVGNFINLAQRERKRNYDVDEYFRDALQAGGGRGRGGGERRRRGLQMLEFQFYDRARLEEIQRREFELLDNKASANTVLKELRKQDARERRALGPDEEPDESLRARIHKMEQDAEDGAFELPEELQEEKRRLVEKSFGHWSRKDFKSFIGAMERHGREDLDAIAHDVAVETGKAEEDVQAYYATFWKRYEEIPEAHKLIERIEKGERRITRLKDIKEALRRKVGRHSDPWRAMKLNYGSNRGKMFTPEEDVFLVNMMHRYGYGEWERIRLEIRRAWQFRFDWFFKSRNAAELQRRCDILIRIIEKENDDAAAADEEDEEEEEEGGEEEEEGADEGDEDEDDDEGEDEDEDDEDEEAGEEAAEEDGDWVGDGDGDENEVANAPKKRSAGAAAAGGSAKKRKL